MGTWISQKSPHRGIKNNVLFIYEADFVLCADFIIYCLWYPREEQTAGSALDASTEDLFYFSPGNYQSICTGKNQTMLPYF